MHETFPIKGRYVVALWLMPFVYLPGLGVLEAMIGQDAPWYWFDVAYFLYAQYAFQSGAGE